MNTPLEKKDRRGGARPGAGRPSYQPTQQDRNIVLAMRGGGMTDEQICKLVGENGIDEKTLRKHFRHELDAGIERTNSICISWLVAGGRS